MAAGLSDLCSGAFPETVGADAMNQMSQKTAEQCYINVEIYCQSLEERGPSFRADGRFACKENAIYILV